MFIVKFKLEGCINIPNAQTLEHAEYQARDELFRLNAVFFDIRNIDICRVTKCNDNYHCPNCNGDLEIENVRTNKYTVAHDGSLQYEFEHVDEKVRCIGCDSEFSYDIDWGEHKLIIHK